MEVESQVLTREDNETGEYSKVNVLEGNLTVGGERLREFQPDGYCPCAEREVEELESVVRRDQEKKEVFTVEHQGGKATDGNQESLSSTEGPAEVVDHTVIVKVITYLHGCCCWDSIS